MSPRVKTTLVALLPLAVFAGLAGLFFVRLGAGDASVIPSPLIGKPLPVFALGPVAGLAVPGLSDVDLRKGRVTVLNVFASWCLPCKAEHPVLQQLAADKELAALGLAVAGIAYKDDPEKTRRFLTETGNPYSAVGDDATGRTFIDLGAYGVPETYIVKGDGTIAYKFVGPMSAETLRRDVLPAIAKAMR